ncbi:hypothetical protein [Cellulomonas sp. Leaf395]|uniref:hypothetical protein n=1 Tax=Cellulomonas sp. Leaf395 TaxID=1736362 RepID=UPI0006FF033C|nr:hypothetical protein [Cellulomonas sp. Leaf395]KQS96964.1 hypothetical protein ASG23_15265 [Cellulomonas sp. Leaf395]
MLTRFRKTLVAAALAAGLLAIPLVLPQMAQAGSDACAPSRSDRLIPGEKLSPGQNIASLDGRYTFGLEFDGTVAIRTATGGALWKKGPYGAGSTLAVEDGSDLVVRDKAGVALWRTGIKSDCAAVVVLNDGRVVLAENTTELWSIPSTRAKRAAVVGWGAQPTPSACAPNLADRLVPGESLAVGQQISSPRGTYTLVLNVGGDLLIRTETGGSVWKKSGGPGARLNLTTSGDLQLVTAEGALVWHNSVSSSCATVAVQDDGRVVALSDGKVVWAIPTDRGVVAASPTPTPTAAPEPTPTTAPTPTPTPAPAPAPAPAPTTATPTPTPSATSGGSALPKPGTRDPVYYPFASSAPWNIAVGSAAQFESATAPRTADFLRETPVVNSTRWSIAVEIATNDDPLATVTNLNNGAVYKVRVPRDTEPTYGTDKHVGVIQPDGRTAWEFYKFTNVGTDRWTTTRAVQTDLTGDGMADGARASGISFYIGLIREKELAELSINHVLAIGLPDEVLKDGPVWPARTQDSNGKTAYSGNVPMGTMAAIPPNVNIDAMNLTPEGRALGHALQDYGALVLVRSGTASLFCEQSCNSVQAQAASTDFRQLYPLMRVITNNTATTPGGGGTPRQPALPSLAP